MHTVTCQIIEDLKSVGANNSPSESEVKGEDDLINEDESMSNGNEDGEKGNGNEDGEKGNGNEDGEKGGGNKEEDEDKGLTPKAKRELEQLKNIKLEIEVKRKIASLMNTSKKTDRLTTTEIAEINKYISELEKLL